MDLADTPEEADFRARVHAWLADAIPTLPWPEPADLTEKLPFWRTWQKLLVEGGFAGMSWPREYGGQGADAKIRSIFTEEADRAGAPERLNTVGEDFAGPTIVAFGTDGQKERFLSPILTGDELWCQLFSEPESGSDLASLRTKAVRTEGGWRVTGQKIWTSRAHLATNAILLARTGGGDRHRGITYILLPMDSPGVAVRPLVHMLGEAEFNEVFLDDVLVPDELVVGEVDGGWTVAMATLGFERVGIATGRVNTKRAVDDIVADVRRMTGDDGRPLGEDPLVRQQVADLYGRALVHHAIGSGCSRSPPPTAPRGRSRRSASSTSARWWRTSPTSGCPLSPLGGQLAPEEQEALDARWVRLAYQARGTAIAGGSTFIQRNIVAERMLGLPRATG